uniref:Uncharacterized protein n=1 Tax=Rhizophora mucronata TaxID=61149 RepID=A0A2P2KY26_RHIMU
MKPFDSIIIETLTNQKQICAWMDKENQTFSDIQNPDKNHSRDNAE